MSKTLSLSQLASYLATIRGATFATLSALTIVKTVANCPLGEVRKLSRVNVTLAHNYGNSVNNQRAREGLTADFIPVARKWGKHTSPVVVEYKGQHYMATRVNRSLSSTYLVRGSNGLLRVVSATAVMPWLKPDKGSGRQKTKKAILERDYSLKSVISLVVNGERLRIRHS
jgi:hypothetical protein